MGGAFSSASGEELADSEEDEPKTSSLLTPVVENQPPSGQAGVCASTPVKLPEGCSPCHPAASSGETSVP